MPSSLTSRRAPSSKNDAWLNDKLAPIREVLRRKDYTIKGSLSFVNVASANGELKTMNFRRLGPRHEISGPFVAKANTMDQFLIVSPWRGIPPIVDNEKREQCSKCLAKCFLCDGNGKVQCQSFGCGGSGIAHLPKTHFQDDTSGVARCHDDDGKPVEQCPKCVTCSGSGKMTCNGCFGSGKKATGKKDQSITEYKTFNLCEGCGGSGWVTKEIGVSVMDFACGTTGPMLTLGPIVAFSLAPPQDSPHRKTVLHYDVKDDLEGDPMVMLLASSQIPCEAFLLGGFAQERM